MENIDLKKLIKEHPVEHIAIIMDGNGRWAKKRNLDRTEGHKVGSERVIDITRHCDELGIKYLSLYAFSTENWSRPKTEVNKIMELLSLFINNKLDELHKNNVKLEIMGDLSALSFLNRQSVNYAINKTKSNTGLVLNIGLNYGSRKEIVRAVKSISRKVLNNEIEIDSINEDMISNNLYTSQYPDPDILIRTGGEKRLSNFMLYQLAYTEFYFTSVYWPDFDNKELENAIINFLKRDRRFGGLNDE